MGERSELPWSVEEPSGTQHPRIYSADGRLVAEIGNAENGLADFHRFNNDARLIVEAANGHTALVAGLRRIINADRVHRGVTSEDAYECDGPLGAIAREVLAAAGISGGDAHG